MDYLGYYLPPFKKKSSRQSITERQKFYLFDTAVANYLKKFTYHDMEGEEAGKAFEHYIFLELTAYRHLNEKRDQLFYWRIKEGDEVDFIIQNLAIEAKITTPIDRRHLKGLPKFGREFGHSLHVVSLEPYKREMVVE
jgi:predicted AAA+ superfamily ATPase